VLSRALGRGHFSDVVIGLCSFLRGRIFLDDLGVIHLSGGVITEAMEAVTKTQFGLGQIFTRGFRLQKIAEL